MSIILQTWLKHTWKGTSHLHCYFYVKSSSSQLSEWKFHLLFAVYTDSEQKPQTFKKCLFVTRKYNTFSESSNIEPEKIIENSIPTRASRDYKCYTEGKIKTSWVSLLSKLPHYLVLKHNLHFFSLYCFWYNFKVRQITREWEGRKHVLCMTGAQGTEEAGERQEQI